jgi:predicted transglutaminase-like cysteine proteinase
VYSGLNIILRQRITFTTLVVCLLLWHVQMVAAYYDFDKLASLARERYGDEAYQDIVQLEQLIAQIKSVPELERLKKINDFFNRKILFADDVAVWGERDYWATPLESLGKQAGDCEDYTIAKYMFLKAANIPNQKLRLNYVRATMNKDGRLFSQAHMVLSYYATPESEPLILDNLNTEIYPASARKDLSPIFSFNDKGLWVGNSNKPRADSQAHLSRWRDVLLRMRLDGLE